MSQIKQFNNLLNRSRHSRKDTTDSYRDHIDTTIRSVLREQPTDPQVCIIGAGKCTDFSLSIFLEYSSNVIVSDIDQASLETCVGQRRNVVIEAVEYTGFESIQFFETFGHEMWHCHTTDDVDQYITRMIAKVEDYRFLPDYERQVDVVFVSPIYTQLIYHQIVSECIGLIQDGYNRELAQYCQERMLREMPGVIARFNRNLISLLNDNGTLLVLSDVFEMKNDSEFYRKVAFSIKQKDVMDEIYRNYQETYGFGLGDYGLYQLEESLQKTKNRWLLWRFNDDKSYAVHLCIYKQNNKGGTK